MWPEHARRVFDSFPSLQGHGCHLILISTHPQEDNGPWPRSHVQIFRSPNFLSDNVPVHKLGSIGCGNDYDPCREAIERYSNNLDSQDFLMKGEIGSSGGMGTMLGFNLTRLLMQVRPGGVSSHLHYCWVYRGQVIIKPNDLNTIGRWTGFESGSGVNHNRAVLSTPYPGEPSDNENNDVAFRMPRIATTWEELCELIDSRNLNADGCVA